MNCTTTVISFCSNDFRFLSACVDGVRPFSSQIIITVCDRFFDGSEENYALLQEALSRFPDCTFLLFAFDPKHTYRYASPLFPEHVDWRHEWHNTGRFLSYYELRPETEWVLFLDCDEIVDGARFSEWLRSNCDKSAYRFLGYRHFRAAKYIAEQPESLGLLVRKTALHPDLLWDADERMGIFFHLPGEKSFDTLGLDGSPLISHYTGVRTQEEFKRKCTAWGHHWERDWEQLIEEAFAAPFEGKDFVRHYTYREHTPLFDPLLVEIPKLERKSLEQFRQEAQHFPHVITIDRRRSFRRALCDAFL